MDVIAGSSHCQHRDRAGRSGHAAQQTLPGFRASSRNLSLVGAIIVRERSCKVWCWPPKIDPMLNVMESVSITRR